MMMVMMVRLLVAVLFLFSSLLCSACAAPRALPVFVVAALYSTLVYSTPLLTLIARLSSHLGACVVVSFWLLPLFFSCALWRSGGYFICSAGCVSSKL
jgi:hypothetical protein